MIGIMNAVDATQTHDLPESDDAEAIADEMIALVARSPMEAMTKWRAQSLSMDQVHVLMACRSLGAITMSHLAELRGVSLPNATGIVGRLEERGFVERMHDEHDRRLVMVRLTAAGIDAITELEVARRNTLIQVLREMPADDRRLLVRVIPRFMEASRRVRARDTASALVNDAPDRMPDPADGGHVNHQAASHPTGRTQPGDSES